MQNRSIKIICIFLSFVSSLWADQPNSILVSISKEKKVILSNEQLAKSLSSKMTSPELNAGKINVELNEYNVKNNLKRFDLILTKEKKEENIFSLEMNRIVCYLQLARIYRIKSGGKTIVADEEMYLKKAMSTIDFLLKKESISKDAQSQLKYFQGIATMDLGMKELSRKSFEDAIEINPNALYVPSLSLYLSDLLYDENSLDKAKTSYLRFYERMSPEEKDLADYKIAWINLNQSNIDTALELFKKLIQNSNAFSIVQDSALSLAVAWSDRYEEDEVLKRVDELKISEDKKVKILQSVYDSYLKSESRERRKIWKRLLSSVKTEEDVTKLLSNEIEFLSFNYKYDSDLELLLFMQSYLKTNLAKVKTYQSVNLMALGQDLEGLIAKTLTNYQKNKNEKNYKPLNISISSYLMFTTFKKQVDVASLYIDLMNERNESDKLISFCWKIVKNPFFSTLENKAKLTILLETEKKYLKNPKENQDNFFNLLNTYLKDPKVDQWLTVSQKYYEYLIKVNKFTEAEEQMIAILNASPSEEHFLKLIAVKFELKKCTEIINLLKNKKDLSSQLTEYKRECFLSTAKESRKELSNEKSKDVTSFLAYQKNILEFIELASGPKKEAAIVDYLNTFDVFLYGSKSLENVETLKKEFDQLLSLQYFNIRFDKDVFVVFQHEIDRLIERGDFKKALLYLDGCDAKKNCKEYQSLYRKIKEMQILDEANSINKLAEHNIEASAINYSSLLNPEIIVEKYLKKDLKLDLRLILVSARLMKINWSDPLNKNLYEKLETFLNKDEILLNTIPTWKLLNKVNLPEIKGKHRLRDQDVMYLMKKVQATRKNLLTDLSKISLISQKELLQKAQEVESKMAEIINASPMPKNLDSSKKAEYELGLKQLSEEFVKQAETYQQTISNLEPQIVAKKIRDDDLLIFKSPTSYDTWTAGKKNELEIGFKSFIESGHFYQAFFYIDYLNSLNKIEKEDYYFKRSFLLLFTSIKRDKKEPMIEYVKTELEANKQSTVINQWIEWSKK